MLRSTNAEPARRFGRDLCLLHSETANLLCFKLLLAAGYKLAAPFNRSGMISG